MKCRAEVLKVEQPLLSYRQKSLQEVHLVIRTRSMLVHLLFVSFWIPSSSARGQEFTEFKRISDLPEENGHERLMRLRTCREKFTVQCELCEVMRIVNASYAVSGVRKRNENEGCSDIIFKEEFDCLHSVDKEYFENITESCNGTQFCGLVRRKERLNCDPKINISSCCVEIYYTCERRKDISVSSLFRANDSSGNTYVSLQCESSDLVVDSVLLAFNSSEELNVQGVCYKISPNTQHVNKRCERMGCTDLMVSGTTGCGADKYTINYGVNIYYFCNDNATNKCRGEATTIWTSTISKIQISANIWIIVAITLVVAVFVSLLIGLFAYAKRMAKIRTEQQMKTALSPYQETPFSANGESLSSPRLQSDLEEYSYPDISSIRVQEYDLESSQYCEIRDLEVTAQQKICDPERKKGNGANKKTGKGTDPGRENGIQDECREAGKLELDLIYDEVDDRGENLKPFYSVLTDLGNDEKFVYSEVCQSRRDATAMHTEVNRSNQKSKPIFDKVFPSINDSKVVYRNVDSSGNDSLVVYRNVIPSARD